MLLHEGDEEEDVAHFLQFVDREQGVGVGVKKGKKSSCLLTPHKVVSFHYTYSPCTPMTAPPATLRQSS